MQETIESPGLQGARPSPPPGAPLAVLFVAIALAFGLWFLTRSSSSPNSSSRGAGMRAMTSAELGYVPNIAIEDIALSRAQNFIHQEVTILNADVSNRGAQSVISLTLQIEFDDALGQIALRESRSVLGNPPVPLLPNDSRRIEISFDHVPPSWNMQQPAVRVSHLQLAP